ncbi:hypothetical protein AGLY_002856 [Aphis glycines]|uniref:Uncharacterized protein n=1 Tax=Aphis glycines TaxID=307491 RepID=A0A6G0U1H2_APHGL|nr:hypothetical protein AGLY_002856 [Aphis glycines]
MNMTCLIVPAHPFADHIRVYRDYDTFHPNAAALDAAHKKSLHMFYLWWRLRLAVAVFELSILLYRGGLLNPNGFPFLRQYATGLNKSNSKIESHRVFLGFKFVGNCNNLNCRYTINIKFQSNELKTVKVQNGRYNALCTATPPRKSHTHPSERVSHNTNLRISRVVTIIIKNNVVVIFYAMYMITTKLEINGRTLFKTKTLEKPLCVVLRVIIEVAEIFTPFENYITRTIVILRIPILFFQRYVEFTGNKS